MTAKYAPHAMLEFCRKKWIDSDLGSVKGSVPSLSSTLQMITLQCCQRPHTEGVQVEYERERERDNAGRTRAGVPREEELELRDDGLSAPPDSSPPLLGGPNIPK